MSQRASALRRTKTWQVDGTTSDTIPGYGTSAVISVQGQTDVITATVA